jgi:hypothetical protein
MRLMGLIRNFFQACGLSVLSFTFWSFADPIGLSYEHARFVLRRFAFIHFRAFSSRRERAG